MNTSRKSILKVIIILFSLGLCARATTTIVDLWHRRDIMRVRQMELEQKTRKNAKLEAKLAEINQEEYVEKIARDTLGLVKEGEAIVILPKLQITNTNDQKNTLHNWQKWWRLFF